MDDYLDLLIASSALSAKASLLSALLPLDMPATLHRELTRNLSTTDMDEVLSLCAVMDDDSLLSVAKYVKSSLMPSYVKDFRQRVLCAAALAPVITSFEPDNQDPEIDIHTVAQYIIGRKTYEVTSVALEVAIARGAGVKMLTSGINDDDVVTDTEMIWLGTRHELIAYIAPELQLQGSSDPILITSLLRGSSVLPMMADVR